MKTKRPEFWNTEKQDIDRYWFTRISIVAYTILSAIILIHQFIFAKEILPIVILPLFLLPRALYLLIEVAKEKKVS